MYGRCLSEKQPEYEKDHRFKTCEVFPPQIKFNFHYYVNEKAIEISKKGLLKIPMIVDNSFELNTIL